MLQLQSLGLEKPHLWPVHALLFQSIAGTSPVADE